MSTLLQVMDVTKVYKNQPKPGLDHVSFKVAQGEFLGIMGASGSGKPILKNLVKDRPLISAKTIWASSFRNISFWIA